MRLLQSGWRRRRGLRKSPWRANAGSWSRSRRSRPLRLTPRRESRALQSVNGKAGELYAASVNGGAEGLQERFARVVEDVLETVTREMRRFDALANVGERDR